MHKKYFVAHHSSHSASTRHGARAGRVGEYIPHVMNVVCAAGNGWAELALWDVPLGDAIVSRQNRPVEILDRIAVGKVDCVFASFAGRRRNDVWGQGWANGNQPGHVVRALEGVARVERLGGVRDRLQQQDPHEYRQTRDEAAPGPR